ncbi:MAG: c-type cytochrome [Chromatiaceae bacterium]|jgi:cytochrome c5|nr:c-type cytochrome [Chromatiaceae bacterium]
MPRLVGLLALTLLAALAASGCGEPDPQARAPSTELPTFDDDRLMAGRTLWIGTCRACHLLGVAGAPAITDFAEWDLRLPKGRDALYTSALHGIPADEQGKYRMPPQGGNPRLSPDQVRLAVDYKLAAIEALRAAGQGNP